ncbi:MAG: carboxypeptidase M32 [Aureliella sp.]
MADPQTTFDRVLSHIRDTAKLETTLSMLEWDDHAYLPPGGHAYRAEQVTLLSGLVHQRRTAPQLGQWLEELGGSPLAEDRHSPVGAAIAGWLRDYRRQVRLPQDLVEALARATSLGQQAWVAARAVDSWPDFRPHLDEITKLRRQEAELLAELVGPDGELYDALLDQYEEGARTKNITAIFAQLRDELVKLLGELQASADKPSGASWRRAIALPLQRDASRWIATAIGYSFERGRLDETAHPFCTTLGPSDCRILTRYHEDNFPSGFYSTLHEAGHGLYEQGLPTDWFGTPPGSAASLGVHESQSRLWENFVGRSAAFWRWCFPQLKQRFGSAWSDLNSMQVFRDANLVEPSLIRVEADEVTYNLHILIRFELEQELIAGELAIDDAPQAWNDRYERYLGIKPHNHRDGILQDVHWSAGLVGYFPTYTLGNLYAAQLMEAAKRDLGNVDALVEAGEFTGLLQWLRDKIHCQGRCFQPDELIRQTTGKAISAEPLVAYLREKLVVAYGMV